MSLTMCVTATVVVAEVGLTIYNMNKAGVFDSIKDKFKKVKIPDIQVQPNLKEITWKSYTQA